MAVFDKLCRTAYGSLQKRTELSQCQWWVTHGRRQCVLQSGTRNSETSLYISLFCQIAMCCRAKVTSVDKCVYISVRYIDAA